MSSPNASDLHQVSDRLAKNAMRHFSERLIEMLLFAAATVSVLTTVGIVYVLVSESINFFSSVSIVDFLTDNQWTPLFDDAHYGIMVLISGTLVSSGVALLVAIPMGTIIAIYLSEFFGYFALLIVTPLLQTIFPQLPGFSLLSAGLVMGIMIVPYIASLSEDAMRAVPMSMREGSYAMGATKLYTVFHVVVPAAVSGLAASYILAISRAVGKTMILAVAAGMQPNLTWNPMEPAATITSYIVQVALGDLPHGSIGYQTIFAAGLTLLLITLAFNIAGQWLRRRFREAY